MKALPFPRIYSGWRIEVSGENQLGQLRSIRLNFDGNPQAQRRLLKYFLLPVRPPGQKQFKLVLRRYPDFHLCAECVLAASAGGWREYAAISLLEYRA